MEIEIKQIECLNPKYAMQFTTDHLDFPKGLHYALDVVEKALNQAHRFTNSAERIAVHLREEHQIHVSSKTVQSRINNFPRRILKIISEFIKKQL